MENIPNKYNIIPGIYNPYTNGLPDINDLNYFRGTPGLEGLYNEVDRLGILNKPKQLPQGDSTENQNIDYTSLGLTAASHLADGINEYLINAANKGLNTNAVQDSLYGNSLGDILNYSSRANSIENRINNNIVDYSGVNNNSNLYNLWNPENMQLGVNKASDLNKTGTLLATGVSDTIKGAKLGALFGPIGAAVGGVAGAAVGVGRGMLGAAQGDKLADYANNQVDMANNKTLNNFTNQATFNRILNMRKANIAADGGQFETDNGVNIFNVGGTHVQNPYGGILQGVDSEGNPNLVEQGEVKFNDYIFSRRNKINSALVKNYILPEKIAGMTFAEAAEYLQRDSAERPDDPISKNYLNDVMGKLQGAQEEYKAKKQARQLAAIQAANVNAFAEGGSLDNPPKGKKAYYDKNGNKIELHSNLSPKYYDPIDLGDGLYVDYQTPYGYAKAGTYGIDAAGRSGKTIYVDLNTNQQGTFDRNGNFQADPNIGIYVGPTPGGVGGGIKGGRAVRNAKNFLSTVKKGAKSTVHQPHAPNANAANRVNQAFGRYGASNGTYNYEQQAAATFERNANAVKPVNMEPIPHGTYDISTQTVSYGKRLPYTSRTVQGTTETITPRTSSTNAFRSTLNPVNEAAVEQAAQKYESFARILEKRGDKEGAALQRQLADAVRGNSTPDVTILSEAEKAMSRNGLLKGNESFFNKKTIGISAGVVGAGAAVGTGIYYGNKNKSTKLDTVSGPDKGKNKSKTSRTYPAGYYPGTIVPIQGNTSNVEESNTRDSIVINSPRYQPSTTSTNRNPSRGSVSYSSRTKVSGSPTVVATEPPATENIPSSTVDSPELKEEVKRPVNPYTPTTTPPVEDVRQPVFSKPHYGLYAPAMYNLGQAVTDALGLTNRPDYTLAENIERNAAQLNPIAPRLNNDYESYIPYDVNITNNQLTAQNAAQNRLSREQTNKSAQAANLAALQYAANNQGFLANLQAQQANEAKRMQIAQYNHGINRENAATVGQYDQLNLNILNNRLNMMNQAAQARDASDTARAQTIAANRSQAFTDLGVLGRHLTDLDMTRALANAGVFGVQNKEMQTNYNNMYPLYFKK